MLSRRSILATAAAGAAISVATARAASFGNPDQPAEGAVNVTNPKALTDPEPQDPGQLLGIPMQKIDPVPVTAYPSFQPVTPPPPPMPANWSGVALLHPFSPPPSTDSKPDNPFFQLCVANVAYSKGNFFSAQITGCHYGSWWYVITEKGKASDVAAWPWETLDKAGTNGITNA
jgi:hypothetical protein